MFSEKKKWLTVAVINLSVVALLGVILRSKIMFSIPGIDFKNFLQSHSHFAFGGWITLCLLTLMTYEILPEQLSRKPIYKWLLTSIFLCACGMLFSFPFIGYKFLSILFSTLFIFVTYAYAWVFIKDLAKSKSVAYVKILSVTAMLSLVLSSAGPFTLAYLLASHSGNSLLYRDSIYTYLHLQYNGFFTLAVFALFLNLIPGIPGSVFHKNARRFAIMLSVSVLPTLALSYLWHFENGTIHSIAVFGCGCLLVMLIMFFSMMRSAGSFLATLDPFVKRLGLLSMIAFVLKSLIQTGIIFPSIGNAVYGDRPIIIGYLHLVMLGYVTLYLLSHLVQNNHFSNNIRIAKTGIIIFASGVIANELILMTQGLTAMIRLSSTMYPLLLFIAAIWLFTGASTIAYSSLRNFKN
jgi:hypothetical protein